MKTAKLFPSHSTFQFEGIFFSMRTRAAEQEVGMSFLLAKMPHSSF